MSAMGSHNKQIANRKNGVVPFGINECQVGERVAPPKWGRVFIVIGRNAHRLAGRSQECIALSHALRDSGPASPRSHFIRIAWSWPLGALYCLRSLYIILFPSCFPIGVSQYIYIEKRVVKSCENALVPKLPVHLNLDLSRSAAPCAYVPVRGMARARACPAGLGLYHGYQLYHG